MDSSWLFKKAATSLIKKRFSVPLLVFIDPEMRRRWALTSFSAFLKVYFVFFWERELTIVLAGCSSEHIPVFYIVFLFAGL